MICDECKTELIENNGFLVCPNCGLEHEQILESPIPILGHCNRELSPNTKNFSHSYVGLCESHDNTEILPTFLGYENKCNVDYLGDDLPIEQIMKYRRLARRNIYSHCNKVISVKLRCYQMSEDLIKMLNLSHDIITDSRYLMNKILKTGIHINYISAFASCIVQSCRKHLYPISIQDICETCKKMGYRVNPKLIIRDFGVYGNLLRSKPSSVLCYIEKRISQLQNSEDAKAYFKFKQMNMDFNEFCNMVRRLCVENYKKFKLSHKNQNPFFMSASLVYATIVMYCHSINHVSCISQKLAKNIFEVAEYTIRDHFCHIFKLGGD